MCCKNWSMKSLHWMGLQSKAAAPWAAPVLWTTVSWLGSTEVRGETNLIGLSRQSFRRRRMCLTPPLSLQGVGFLLLYILEKVCFKAGVVVLYCIGSIVTNSVLIFWTIQSTGWHERINIRWLDDEVLTTVFISTLSLKQGREILSSLPRSE